MAAAHILVGIFAWYNVNSGVLVMIIAFIFVYLITNGSLVWLYCSEVVVDSALGFVMLVLWAMVFLLSLTTDYLFASALQSYGVFWLFGSFCLIGGFFTYFYVKETVGLTDKEKKSVYL